MTKDKELKALFIMCRDLKAQVKALSEEVKALHEARHAPKKMLESMNNFSEVFFSLKIYSKQSSKSRKFG